MKIEITSCSTFGNDSIVISASSVDSALRQIKENEIIIPIDEDISWYADEDYIEKNGLLQDTFIISFNPIAGIDVRIMLYDFYYE